jgi:hypothetical protein
LRERIAELEADRSVKSALTSDEPIEVETRRWDEDDDRK